MDISFSNIGKSYECKHIYLETEDYIELLKEEIGFGKILDVYIGLTNIILKREYDVKDLNEWLLDPRLYDVIKNTNELYNIINGSINKIKE